MVLRKVRFGVLLVSASILAATRFPGASPAWGYAALAAAGLLVAVGLYALSPRAPPSMRPTTYVVALLLLLMPTHHDAWLAGLPDWPVALLFVLALHLFFPETGATAPSLGEDRTRRSLRTTIRFIPAIVVAVVLVALPWIAPWTLPPRIHAAYELQGAMAPVWPLALILPVLVAVGAVRATRARAPASDADADPATVEGEAA